MPRCFLACLAVLLALCTPARAEEEYSALRAFGIDEIRLGGMKHNLDDRGSKGGAGYTISREGGFDVSGEVLFVSPWSQPENPILDFLLRPRPIFGATVSTQGETSMAYLGAAWSLPLFKVLFVEATFGGAIHDGPLTSTGPNYVEAYGCRVSFHESGSLGIKLGDNWRLMGTIEHMSNGPLCLPNPGLTNYGARLGYKFSP
jgi:lipid A 3-O-deacylase